MIPEEEILFDDAELLFLLHSGQLMDEFHSLGDDFERFDVEGAQQQCQQR
jgi:hypothetical protein